MSGASKVEWWVNSKRGSVAHAIDRYGHPLCDRVVLHADAWQLGTTPGFVPRCKSCAAVLDRPDT